MYDISEKQKDFETPTQRSSRLLGLPFPHDLNVFMNSSALSFGCVLILPRFCRTESIGTQIIQPKLKLLPVFFGGLILPSRVNRGTIILLSPTNWCKLRFQLSLTPLIHFAPYQEIDVSATPTSPIIGNTFSWIDFEKKKKNSRRDLSTILSVLKVRPQRSPGSEF